MSSLLIGLTGGIGSGKTAVSNYFSQQGIDVVDADVIAHQCVEKGSEALEKIQEHFGEDILLEDGKLNRSKLRDYVFNSDEERLWLENLLHPIIRKTILHAINKISSPYGLLVAPLLLENKLDKYCQRVLIVDLPESLQIERSVSRDQKSEEQIRAIIKAQISRNDRLQKADDIILNDKDFDHLFKQAQIFHEQYLELSKQFQPS